MNGERFSSVVWLVLMQNQGIVPNKNYHCLRCQVNVVSKKWAHDHCQYNPGQRKGHFMKRRMFVLRVALREWRGRSKDATHNGQWVRERVVHSRNTDRCDVDGKECDAQQKMQERCVSPMALFWSQAR